MYESMTAKQVRDRLTFLLENEVIHPDVPIICRAGTKPLPDRYVSDISVRSGINQDFTGVVMWTPNEVPDGK